MFDASKWQKLVCFVHHHFPYFLTAIFIAGLFFPRFQVPKPFVGPRCPTEAVVQEALLPDSRRARRLAGARSAWTAVVAGVERVPLDLVHITLEDFNITLF